MTTDLLREAGEALYGPRWQSALARELGISGRHMRRLVAGSTQIRASMTDELVGLCMSRFKSYDELCRRLLSARAQMP